METPILERFARSHTFSPPPCFGDIPLFRGLAPDDVERLSTYATTRIFPQGATIFSKGDPGQKLFAVCSGIVRIAGACRDGQHVVLNLIRGSELFGEVAVLDGRSHGFDATAMTECKLMVIDRNNFTVLVETRPEIALKLINLLCARLRRTSEQVEEALFLDLSGRLAKLLLRLTENAAVIGQYRKCQKLLLGASEA